MNYKSHNNRVFQHITEKNVEWTNKINRFQQQVINRNPREKMGILEILKKLKKNPEMNIFEQYIGEQLISAVVFTRTMK